MSITPHIVLGTPAPPAAAARDSIPSSFNWATVVDDSPLTIRLDGQSDPLAVVPDSLIGVPPVNARVWVQQWGKRVVILGLGGGGGAGSAWGTFNPSWTGWSPTTTARYVKAADGTVTYSINGQLVAAPTGAVTFTLPVAPLAPPAGGFKDFGSGLAKDASAGTYWAIIALPNSGSVVNLQYRGGSSNWTPANFSGSTPFAWASGDTFHITGTYEAA